MSTPVCPSHASIPYFLLSDLPVISLLSFWSDRKLGHRPLLSNQYIFISQIVTFPFSDVYMQVYHSKLCPFRRISLSIIFYGKTWNGCNTVASQFCFASIWRDGLFINQNRIFLFLNWSYKTLRPPHLHSESWSRGAVIDVIGDIRMWDSCSCSFPGPRKSLRHRQTDLDSHTKTNREASQPDWKWKISHVILGVGYNMRYVVSRMQRGLLLCSVLLCDEGYRYIDVSFTFGEDSLACVWSVDLQNSQKWQVSKLL